MPERRLEEMVRVRDAIARVASWWGVKVSDLTGSDRSQPLASIRQLAMLAARESGGSYPTIGKALNRHHTTVMHGVRNAREAIRPKRLPPLRDPNTPASFGDEALTALSDYGEESGGEADG